MAKEMRKLTVRMDAADHERVKYMASKRNMTVNDFIVYCTHAVADIELGAYDTDSLIINRMNQQIDETALLASAVSNMQKTVESLGSMLVAMASGENYLADDAPDDPFTIARLSGTFEKDV